MKIPFNIPYTTGKEIDYINEAINKRHLSGNGPLTRKCQEYFEKRWGFKKALLTTSCTDALEMCALLIDIKPGDEVIVPAYTFVSTALAFARQGARIVFVDSRPDSPLMDECLLEKLITPKTKAIVPVHYAGIACDMDRIMDIANRHKIYVIEDAAYGINSFYKGKALGGIGNLGCFSFHETKPIHCGEGGLLVINDERFIERAEIILEKGTNRTAFSRGDVSYYEWVDTGSSFLISDINAAFLYAQLEHLDQILEERMILWELYFNTLNQFSNHPEYNLPSIPGFAKHNASIFYLIFKDENTLENYRKKFEDSGIQAITHYLDLSKSPYYKNNYKSIGLKTDNATTFANTLLRLPLYNGQTNIDTITTVLNT